MTVTNESLKEYYIKHKEKAKEHNEAFLEQYTLMLNKLVAEFSKEYVDKQGRINWDAILELNSKKIYEKL